VPVAFLFSCRPVPVAFLFSCRPAPPSQGGGSRCCSVGEHAYAQLSLAVVFFSCWPRTLAVPFSFGQRRSLLCFRVGRKGERSRSEGGAKSLTAIHSGGRPGCTGQTAGKARVPILGRAPCKEGRQDPNNGRRRNLFTGDNRSRSQLTTMIRSCTFTANDDIRSQQTRTSVQRRRRYPVHSQQTKISAHSQQTTISVHSQQMTIFVHSQQTTRPNHSRFMRYWWEAAPRRAGEAAAAGVAAGRFPVPTRC